MHTRGSRSGSRCCATLMHAPASLLVAVRTLQFLRANGVRLPARRNKGLEPHSFPTTWVQCGAGKRCHAILAEAPSPSRNTRRGRPGAGRVAPPRTLEICIREGGSDAQVLETLRPATEPPRIRGEALPHRPRGQRCTSELRRPWGLAAGAAAWEG